MHQVRAGKRGRWSAVIPGLLQLVCGCGVVCDIGIEDACDPEAYSLPNTREEALQQIDAWTAGLVRDAGRAAVQLGALQTSDPGDIWTECDEALTNRVGTVFDQYPDPATRPALRERALADSEVDFEWSRDFSRGVDAELHFDTGVKLLNVGLEAAFETEEVSIVRVKLGISDTTLREFENPEQVYQRFIEGIAATGSPANALVTGVLQGHVRLKYELLDKNGTSLSASIKLASEINELGTVTAEQGASVEYTEEVTSEASRGEVRESGANPTVFAALTREVEPRYVHADDVDEVCERTTDDDGVGPSLRRLIVQEMSGPVLQIAIEEGAPVGTENHWFVDVENLSTETLDGQVVLSIRNPYGQLLQRLPVQVQRLLPGTVSQDGPVTGYVAQIALAEAVVDASFRR